jgi:replication factor C subunit 2/4
MLLMKEEFRCNYPEYYLLLLDYYSMYVQVVREKVKNFAQLAVASSHPDGKRCPPIKLVILDEADSMTHSAQAALRRTMEKESKTTRFCLICNYISRIIEPLTSRCIKFRFKPLTGEILESKLKDICAKEGVQCTEKGISTLVNTSGGDMRMAITTLQSAARFKGKSEISQEDILEIGGVVPDKFVDAILQACYSDSYDKLEHTVKEFISEGYAAAQLVHQLLDRIVIMDVLSDMQKSVIAERLGLVDRRLCDGADEYLQIMDLGSVVMKQLCHPDSR